MASQKTELLDKLWNCYITDNTPSKQEEDSFSSIHNFIYFQEQKFKTKNQISQTKYLIRIMGDDLAAKNIHWDAAERNLNKKALEILLQQLEDKLNKK